MTVRQKPSINFTRGWPSPALLPPEQIKEAAALALSDPSWKSALEYGPDEGYHPLRHEIARWLTDFYTPREPIPSERICITGGASQNLACVLQTFTDPLYTRNVWMVAPTYFLACRIFEDSGFAGRLKAVPEDEQGVDMEFLEKSINCSEDAAQKAGNTEPKLKPSRPWRKIYKHVIYAVPTFANPSGRVMSLDRRRALVRLARNYDALIVTDDVYDMLQWPSSRALPDGSAAKACLPRLVDIDRYLDGGSTGFGNAVSNGSFSKLIAPGCRTGWAEGTEQLAYGLSQTGSSRSGGCPSHVVASFIHKILSTSVFEKHIDSVLRPSYARRYQRMMSAIDIHLLPLGVTMPQPNEHVAGGYFIWLTLPEGMDAADVAKTALHEEGLRVMDGAQFRVVGDEDSCGTPFNRQLRLCFAWEDEDLLEEGVIRLSHVVKRCALPSGC